VVFAKKSYGQHFLVHESSAEKIGNFIAHLPSGANVLEVGPGTGMLTKYLLKKDINLKVVDADRDMIAHLEKHFPQLEGRIIFSDFLKLDLNEVFNGESMTIIGNFPYNISSQIVFKAIDYKNIVTEVVGMFQKEMADRIVSKPDIKDYSVISVLTQAFFDGNILMKLAPGSFNPPPKVHSAVIRIKRREKFNLDCNERLFKSIVKVTFSQRRKMMRNTLKGMVKDSTFFEDKFFNLRPEQLTVEDFITLTNKIDKQHTHESGN
jgi:16S rRNA (adenine1518-N6/adenine1519-N6)-dimethyltransferase